MFGGEGEIGLGDCIAIALLALPHHPSPQTKDVDSRSFSSPPPAVILSGGVAVVEPVGRRQAESRAAELHKQTHYEILTTRSVNLARSG